MKKYAFVLSLSLLLLIPSCANMRELTQQEQERVFVHDVNLSKVELKTKILSMVNEKFHSGKAVLQVNEDGLISGNTTDLLTTDPFGIIKTYIELTFLIKYQDNQYKIKYVVKNIYSVDSESTHDVNSHNWGLYIEDIDKIISNFEKMTLSYIITDSSF